MVTFEIIIKCGKGKDERRESLLDILLDNFNNNYVVQKFSKTFLYMTKIDLDEHCKQTVVLILITVDY